MITPSSGPATSNGPGAVGSMTKIRPSSISGASGLTDMIRSKGSGMISIGKSTGEA